MTVVQRAAEQIGFGYEMYPTAERIRLAWMAIIDTPMEIGDDLPAQRMWEAMTTTGLAEILRNGAAELRGYADLMEATAARLEAGDLLLPDERNTDDQ